MLKTSGFVVHSEVLNDFMYQLAEVGINFERWHSMRLHKHVPIWNFHAAENAFSSSSASHGLRFPLHRPFDEAQLKRRIIESS